MEPQGTEIFLFLLQAGSAFTNVIDVWIFDTVKFFR